MANRPDGQSARPQRVVFTKSSAERISKAVRKVEAGERGSKPLLFEPRMVGRSDLTLGQFTGTWAIDTPRVVTIVPGTQTVVVYNYCRPSLGGDTSSTTEQRFVIFGKVQKHNENILRPSVVEIQDSCAVCTCVINIGSTDLSDLPGYNNAEVQLLGHNESACLQWYSITTCETAAETVPDEYGWFY